MVSRDPSSDFVGIAKPFSAIEGQGEGKCLAQIVGIGRREAWLIGHADTVVHARERIKNIRADQGQAAAPRWLSCALGLAVRYAS